MHNDKTFFLATKQQMGYKSSGSYALVVSEKKKTLIDYYRKSRGVGRSCRAKKLDALRRLLIGKAITSGTDFDFDLRIAFRDITDTLAFRLLDI